LTKQCDKSQHNKEEENIVEWGNLHFYIIKYLKKQCDKSQHNKEEENVVEWGNYIFI